MKNHVLTRGQWIDDQLIDPPVFNHPGGQVTNGFQLTVSGPQTKYYTLNGSDPRAVGGSAAGAAYSPPITITSNTLVKCRSWNGTAFVNAPSTWPWSALSEVMLVVDPAPLAITEIMYHPRPPSGAAELGYTASDFEFIEIHNPRASACSLVGVRFLEGVSFDFTYGNASTLGAGGYGVVVRNLNAFKARYTNWASLNVLGTYTGLLENRGENLKVGYASDKHAPAGVLRLRGRLVSGHGRRRILPRPERPAERPLDLGRQVGMAALFGAGRFAGSGQSGTDLSAGHGGDQRGSLPPGYGQSGRLDRVAQHLRRQHQYRRLVPQ